MSLITSVSYVCQKGAIKGQYFYNDFIRQTADKNETFMIFRNISIKLFFCEAHFYNLVLKLCIAMKL